MKQLGYTFEDLFNSTEDQLIKDYCIAWVRGMDLSTEDETSDMQVVLGGYVYLVESVDDLKKIITSEYDSKKGYLSLYDTPAAFDHIEILGEYDYYVLTNMTNNAGGNTYIIPKAFAVENVKKSLEMTNVDYS